MSNRHALLLFLVAAAVAGLTAGLLGAPGYMDSDYYFATALRLAQGHGLTEPFLWNYLDNPEGLPHASHLYWMPLTSLVAAASIRLFGDQFLAAQLPFVLLTALLPLVAGRLAFDLSSDSWSSVTAGILAIMSGFYLPFFVTTDAFSLYAVVGSLALWLMASASERPALRKWLGAGLLIGLSNLARVDGILLLAPAGLALAWSSKNRAQSGFVLLLGYLVLILPWWLRNLSVSGFITSPGTAKTLWLLDYNELFSYPPDMLTPERWWQAGVGNIILHRLEAMSLNLQSLIAVNGMIFLTPLVLVAALRLRDRPVVRLTLLYLLLLFGVMSLVFPFPGARGGYFHSSAVVMPLFWALSPIGLEAAVGWGARIRGWVEAQAIRVFRPAMLGLAALFTFGLLVPRLRSPGEAVGTYLESLHPAPGPAAVNNPPGFYLATGLEAVAIPNGPPEALRLVVERYNVSWVVLEQNHPPALAGLFQQPDSIDWLEFRAQVKGAGGSPILLLARRKEASP